MTFNKQYLSAEISKDTFNLVSGFYNIAQKNYSGVLESLMNISSENSQFFYYSKIGQAIAFYELSDNKGLMSTLTQLKEIVRKNKKLDNDNKEIIKSFNKYSLILFNLKIKNLGFVKHRAEQIREEISREAKYFFFREWLLEKFEELNH